MRRILLTISFVMLMLTALIGMLMLDGYRVYRFRTTQTSEVDFGRTDTRGLENLSGSNKIVFRDLKRKLENIPHPIHVLDLSTEVYGYYGEFTADFFGYHQETPSIKHFVRRLIITKELYPDPQNIQTDQQAAETYGLHYTRIPLKKYHLPNTTQKRALLKFVRTLPPQTWIHIYCQGGGRGRTSLIMVMIDIIRNAKTVSLQDIVRRQHLLGSENLLDTTVWRNGTYTHKQLEQRKEFIEKFYEEMRAV